MSLKVPGAAFNSELKQICRCLVEILETKVSKYLLSKQQPLWSSTYTGRTLFAGEKKYTLLRKESTKARAQPLVSSLVELSDKVCHLRIVLLLLSAHYLSLDSSDALFMKKNFISYKVAKLRSSHSLFRDAEMESRCSHCSRPFPARRLVWSHFSKKWVFISDKNAKDRLRDSDYGLAACHFRINVRLYLYIS